MYNIISTGSKGNALLLNEKLLIDCGVAYKHIKDYDFKAVLLTHKHGDHFKKSTIKAIAKNKPLVKFITPYYLAELLIDCGVEKRDINIIETDIWYDIGIAKVSIFPLKHDVENVGYKVIINDKKFFYATDTADLDGIEAKGYDIYFIEANHTEEDIKQRLITKIEKGEYTYEQRAMETHLSKEQADEFLVTNVGPNSQYVYIHEHKEII